MGVTLKDQLSRTITIEDLSRGIVSLVPSQTELLFDLGAGHLVTGVTKFCIHPAEARNKCTIVGGTKNLHFDTIESLRPGLIIANREENNKEDIEYLAGKFPVWVSDVNDLASALQMIRSVADLCNCGTKGTEICDTVQAGFNSLSKHEPLKALYLIWNDPVMAAGNDTFIHDMLQRCGFVNVVQENRYPEIDTAALQPEVVLLSSEPFPFAEKHLNTYRLLFPDAAIVLADGTYFSWYGSRLVHAPAYFNSLRNDIDHLLQSQKKTVS